MSVPTIAPSFAPTFSPTYNPTYAPTFEPTSSPTFSPTEALGASGDDDGLTGGAKFGIVIAVFAALIVLIMLFLKASKLQREPISSGPSSSGNGMKEDPEAQKESKFDIVYT